MNCQFIPCNHRENVNGKISFNKPGLTQQQLSYVVENSCSHKDIKIPGIFYFVANLLRSYSTSMFPKAVGTFMCRVNILEEITFSTNLIG